MTRPLATVAALSACLWVVGCGRPAAPRDPAPLLRDVSAAAGIRYRWRLPGTIPRSLQETIGHGAAFLDYDADGNLDILLVGQPCALYRGDGKGRFTDVTAGSGLETLGQAFSGCAVGDFDGDGFPDLYLTAYRGGALLHNRAGRRFDDITRSSGIPPQPWGTAAAWAPLSPDGRLDLLVGNYVRFEPGKGTRRLCELRDAQGKPVLAACGPIEYDPILPGLYRNRGGGRFVAAPGAVRSLHGRCLGIAAADYDSSGRLRVAFANDEMPGDLLEIPASGDARNVADAVGLAYDREGRVHGGMGLDWGDENGDGRLDLAVATFRLEPDSLYRSSSDGVFVDEAYAAGIGAATRPYVAFGLKWLDFDNDGWLDLAIANGHVQDNIEKINPETALRQPSQLFRNRGDGSFVDDSTAAGPDLRRPIVGRGLATGDYDNDGRVDLLIVDSDGAPLLLHNEAPAGHWLGLALEGKGGNRDGYGAIVTVRAGGRTLVRHCHADGSYLSSSDRRLHFGLGSATTVDSVTIRWPDGTIQKVDPPAPGAYHTVREP